MWFECRGYVSTRVRKGRSPDAARRPGVTSTTPGHAMKGSDRARMIGAIVGKALEPLAEGTGKILVAVALP